MRRVDDQSCPFLEVLLALVILLVVLLLVWASGQPNEVWL